MTLGNNVKLCAGAMSLVLSLALSLALSLSASAQVVPPPTDVVPTQPKRVEERWLIPMDQRPAFGEWREQTEVFSASMWTGVLTNNVRVSHRYFPNEKQTGQIQVALYGGGLQEDASTRGLTEAAMMAWKKPATKDLSHTELKAKLKGWNVGTTGEVAGDYARLTVAGDNVHIEMQFQLAYWLLTKPVIEADALESWKQEQLKEIDSRMRGTRSAFPHVMADAIFPKDDVRGRGLTREQVEAITVEKAQAWLEKLIATAPIEVGFVGRVPREMVFELSQRYFASLPERPLVTTATNADLRRIVKSTSTVTVDRAMPSVTPRAVVSWSFWACDEQDYDRMLPLQMAARIATRRFDAKLKEVLPDRETRGGISWTLNPASTFPGMGLFVGVSTAPPAKADEIHALMLSELRAFAQQGPTEGEMLEAQAAQQKLWQDRLINEGVWGLILESYAYTGIDTGKLMTVPGIVMQVTPEQVRDQLQAIVNGDPATSIVLRPATAGAAPVESVPVKRDN
jgi:predicted Zn-dependent peptidase